MFPRFDVISQACALLHACLPRSRCVALRHDRSAADEQRGLVGDCTWNRNARRNENWRIRSRSPFIDHWTIRFDRESRLIATKYRRTAACKYSWCNKIYFFYIEHTLGYKMGYKNENLLRGLFEHRGDGLFVSIFFLIDDAFVDVFVKYIRYEQQLNGKWQLAKKKKQPRLLSITIWFYENLLATKLRAILSPIIYVCKLKKLLRATVGGEGGDR